MANSVESAITAKGQATIPRQIRERLRLKPADRVKFFVHPDGSVVLLPKRPASVLRGIAKSRRKRPATIAEMEKAVAGAAASTLRRTCSSFEKDVFTAMIALKRGRTRFSDALIATLGETAGCPYTLTFDRKALRLPGVKLA